MQELQTVYIQKLNIRYVTTETITVHHPIVGGVFPLALINSLHTATLNVVDLSFSVVNTPRHFEYSWNIYVFRERNAYNKVII